MPPSYFNEAPAFRSSSACVLVRADNERQTSFPSVIKNDCRLDIPNMMVGTPKALITFQSCSAISVNAAMIAPTMNSDFFMWGLVGFIGWSRKRGFTFDRSKNVERVRTGAGKILEISPADASIRPVETLSRPSAVKSG